MGHTRALFCGRLGGADPRAGARTEEVFRGALQTRAFRDPSNEKQGRAWLSPAARTLHCDRPRRAAKETQLLSALQPSDDDGDVPDTTAEAALGSVELGTVLAQLPELDRLLFTLRYDEGYNAAELSTLLQLPPGTIRSRLSRIRYQLKTKLSEE